MSTVKAADGAATDWGVGQRGIPSQLASSAQRSDGIPNAACPMRILVVTTVHTPLDARIHSRQIRTLVAAGAQVSYAAPWSATATPPQAAAEGVRVIDLPRAHGRKRLRALRAARKSISHLADDHDLVLLHDPELLLAVAGLVRRLPPVVLDVHEDTAAALIDRPWLPRRLRPLAALMVRRVERWAERNVHLTLAERSYQERFSRDHPFVPNVPPRPKRLPPEPGSDRVVYLGRIARSRGGLEILEAARELSATLTFELIGPVDQDLRAELETAVTNGWVIWSGFLPNDEALSRLEGAMAGLSLIHPQPNHAGSLQTKVLEYLSRRIPVVTSDLPVTGRFVRERGVGIVVPTGDIDSVVSALTRLRDDPARRLAMADAGFRLIDEELNWDVAGERFVATLRLWARAS